MQTISTILDNRPILQHSLPGTKHPPSSTDIDARKEEEALWQEAKESWDDEMKKLDIPASLLPKKNRAGARAGTLVVCPVIALHQWKSEIEKFTDGRLTVGTYHGPNRAKEMPHEMMSKYDIVLTTYQCLEQDFRKMMSPNKVACPNCGGKFKIDKLSVHLKYFCGASAQRTEAQQRQRRSADRNRVDGPGSGEGRGGSQKKSKKTKPDAKKSSFSKTSAKKKLHLRGDDLYDSDSDLSLPDQTPVMLSGRKRPSRSGAARTKAKIAKHAKASGDDTDTDGSDYNSDESSDSPSDDSSSSSEEDTKLVTFKKPAPKSKKALSAVERAREKQRQALEAAGNKKGKPAAKKKAFKGKKGRPGDSSSSDSNSDEDVDPMEGVDMDKMLKQAMSGARFSILHSFCWWRVVLDEAHFIKSRSSQTAAAAFSLSSVNRWCLSGTPLQNRVGERKFVICIQNESWEGCADN